MLIFVCLQLVINEGKKEVFDGSGRRSVPTPLRVQAKIKKDQLVV